MKVSNWIMSIYIILVFIGMFAINIFVINYKNIKDNWNDYKCSPLIMPFAGSFGFDPTKNFTDCVSTMQGDFMKIFLQPIEYVISLLGDSAKMFTDAIQDIRGVLDKVRGFLSSILEELFGIFLNVILEIQKLMISIKDLVGKLIGVLVTSLYLMDTSIKTMESIWNGPPGQLLNALCFHPKTNIKLKNGKVLCMDEVKIGDILENGSEVFATMIIKNKKDDAYLSQMYKFKNGVNNNEIYVTDGHLVELENNKFVYVKDHPDSQLSSEMNSDTLICFITDDHIIQIGNYKFGDWEDEGTLPSIISHKSKNII
tara:strand:+ start:874 stop:1812 length:939 start_codon:yes stop_codon:yes gene_type:complete